MGQLDRATKRLQDALDSLERAVESRGGDGDDGEAGLRAALESARQENAALQDAAGKVAVRLDKTIERLKTTLET
ncbi:MAG: hypothetical protein ACTSQ7_05200 [Alphaproteobacteria bacterium]